MGDLNSLIIPKSNSSTDTKTSLDSLIIPKKDTSSQDNPLPGDTSPILNDSGVVDNTANDNNLGNQQPKETGLLESFWNGVKGFFNQPINSMGGTKGAIYAGQLLQDKLSSQKQDIVKQLVGESAKDNTLEQKPIDIYGLIKSGVEAKMPLSSIHPEAVENETQNELANLGLDSKGKPVSTPNLSPEGVNNSLANLNRGFDSQIFSLDSDIKNTKDKLEEGTSHNRQDLVKQVPEIQKDLEDKQKQVADVLAKKQQLTNFYSSIVGQQKALGNQPQFNITEGLDSKYPDFKGMTQNLQLSNQTIDQIQSTPDFDKSYQQKGLELSYVGDPLGQITAQKALDSPTGNFLGKSLSKEQIQAWQYKGISGDMTSLQSSVDRDKKILQNIDKSVFDSASEAIKKGNTLEDVNEHLKNNGISDFRNILDQNIKKREDLINKFKTTIQTNLPDYINRLAIQEVVNKQFKDSPFGTYLGSAIGKVSEIPSNVYKTAYAIKQLINFTESSSEKGAGIFKTEGLPEIEPRDEKGVPISQKESFVFGEHGLQTNWGALTYQGITNTAEILPLLVGAGAIEKLAVAPIAEGLTGYLKIGEIAGEGTALGDLYKIGRIGAQYPTTFTARAVLAYGVPSALVFGQDNIRAEMENKGLTINQAVGLGLLRANMEGAVMAIAPAQMDALRGAWFRGEIKDLYKEEVYKNLIQTNWSKITGKTLTDRAYQLLYGTGKIVEGIGVTSGDILLQQTTTEGANSLIDNYVRANIDKGYKGGQQDPDTKQQMASMLSTIATMLPFGILHGVNAINETKEARFNSLYQVVSSPEYFLSHINERMERGEISKEEALRQTQVIRDASAIHTGLKEDYDSVDKTQNIDDNKKAQLKYELFKNKIEEKGLTDILSKIELEKVNKEVRKSYEVTTKTSPKSEFKPEVETGNPETKTTINLDSGKEIPKPPKAQFVNGKWEITPEPKESTLLDYLKENAEKYKAIKELQDIYNNASSIEKDYFDYQSVVRQLQQQYGISQLNELSPEDALKLRDEFLQKRNDIGETGNPHLYDLYDRLVNRLDLKVKDDEYKSGKNTEGINKKIKEVADIIEKTPNFNDKEHLNIEQQYIYTHYKEQVEDELNNRQSTTKQESDDKTSETQEISPILSTSNKVEPKNDIKEEITNTEETPEPKQSKVVPYLNSQSISITDGTDEQFQNMVNVQIAKLTEIETKSADLGGGNVGPLLVFASPLLGYKARESVETKDGHKDLNNTIDPKFIELHKPEFGIGTKVSFKVNPESTTYSKAAQARFFQNKDVYISGDHLTEQEFNTILSNENNFKEIEVLDEKGNVIGNIHSLDYIRPDRVVEYIGKKGEEISNLAPNIYDLVKNRKTIFDRHEKGQHLDTQVDNKGYGIPAVREDKQFVPFTEAIKDKTVQNSIQIVKNPKDTFHKGEVVVNWKSLIPGQVGAIVPTPNGKNFFLPLKRTNLGGDRAISIITMLKFYREFNRTPEEQRGELNKFAEELTESSHDSRYNLDPRTDEGLRNYISSFISLSKTSDFTGANLSDDSRKSVPFIDVSDGSITLSEARRNYEKLTDDEKNSIKGDYKKLQSVGVNKYSLIGSPDSVIADMEARLNAFLPKRSLNIRNDFFEGAKDVPYELIVTRIINGKFEINKTPDFKNSGKNYPDFVKNNTSTNNLEIPLGNNQNAYFVQPNIGFDMSFGEKEPTPPTETEEETQKRETHEFIDKFKDVKDVKKAKELAKEGEKFPILADWIDSRIKHLDKEQVVKTKYGGDKGHNILAGLKTDYNTLSESEKKTKAGVDILKQINQIAGDLGYSLKALQNFNIDIKTKEGKKIRKIGVGTEIEPIIEGKYEAHNTTVDKDEALKFSNESRDYKFDDAAERYAFKLSNAELKRGFSQIEKGELDKVAAQKILDKVAEWKSSGTIDMTLGRGKFIIRIPVQYEKIAELNKELKEVDNQTPTQEEIEQETKNFDEYYNSLSEEEKKQIDDEYNRETEIDRQGEVGDNEEEGNIREIPTEEEIRQQVEDFYSGKTDKEILDLFKSC